MSQIYLDALGGRYYAVKRRPLGVKEWLIHWKEPGHQPETWKEWSGQRAWSSPKAAEMDLARKAKELHWQTVKPGQELKGVQAHWIPLDTGRRPSGTSCRS